MPMPDDDSYIVYPRSVTCAICDDPACTGDHPIRDPWKPDSQVPKVRSSDVVPRAQMAPPEFEKKHYPEDA